MSKQNRKPILNRAKVQNSLSHGQMSSVLTKFLYHIRRLDPQNISWVSDPTFFWS